MSTPKNIPRRINLYVGNSVKFHKIKDEVRHLWYKTYGEALSTHVIVEKALILMLEYLKNKPSVDMKLRIDYFGRIHK